MVLSISVVANSKAIGAVGGSAKTKVQMDIYPMRCSMYDHIVVPVPYTCWQHVFARQEAELESFVLG